MFSPGGGFVGIRLKYHLKRAQDCMTSMVLARRYFSHDDWTSQQLSAYQNQRLQSLVRHAVKRSPFYKELFAGIDPDRPIRLEDLPTVDKKTLMANFDRVVTDPRLRLAEIEDHLTRLERDEYYLGRYRVLSTGGSSGLTGIFVYSRKEWIVILAAMQRMGRYMDLGPRLPDRLRICTIGAHHPRHGTSRVPESMDFGLAILQRLEATDSIEKLSGRLQAFQPEVLFAYPSIGALLALEQLDGRLRISPRVVVTSAEVCTEDMKEKMQKAWGTTPFNTYSMTEAPFLSTNCTHDKGIHIFEDLAILEVVDEHGRRVPDGELGHKVLLTNLFSYTQPLIRYEITDMVRMSPEPCPCGRPFRLLESIEGRCDDILELEGLHGPPKRVHPLAFRSCLGAIHELRQYQVVHAPDGLHFNLVPRGATDRETLGPRVESIMRTKLEALEVKCPPMHLHFVDQIERDQNQVGKVKLIKKAAWDRP